jgi:thiol-disulfide isomerase/thioredoxin
MTTRRGTLTVAAIALGLAVMTGASARQSPATGAALTAAPTPADAGAPPSSGAETGAATVARVGSERLSADELRRLLEPTLAEQDATRDAELRRMEIEFERTRAALLEARTEQWLDQRVLALEAAARGTTPDALLAAAAAAPVTDADVRRFYDAQQEQIRQPLESVREDIAGLLAEQRREDARRALLDELRRRHDAVAYFEPRREPVAATGAARGPANAPVTVVEFADFQCPFCARLRPVLDELAAAYPADVRIVWRHLPLTSIHAQARLAAEAGVCADEQRGFWPLHAAMLKDPDGLQRDGILAKARDAGLDVDALSRCLDSGRAGAVVDRDLRDAELLGLRGTPATFVNGRFVDGTTTLSRLQRLVEDELQRRR